MELCKVCAVLVIGLYWVDQMKEKWTARVARMEQKRTGKTLFAKYCG